jgi:hypothetical protein
MMSQALVQANDGTGDCCQKHSNTLQQIIAAERTDGAMQPGKQLVSSRTQFEGAEVAENVRHGQLAAAECD